MFNNQVLVILLAQGAPESRLGKATGKRLQLLHPVRRTRLRARQLLQVLVHMRHHLQRRPGRRRVPFFRNARAALVARAAVIGGEAGLHHHRLTQTVRRQALLGNHLQHAVRRLPQQLHRGRLFLELEELQREGIRPATQQIQGLLHLANFRAAAHPPVDQHRLRIIDKKADAVLALHDEFVRASVRRDDRALPACRKLRRSHLQRVRTVGTKVEIHLGVHPVEPHLLQRLVLLLVLFRRLFFSGLGRIGSRLRLGNDHPVVKGLQAVNRPQCPVKPRTKPPHHIRHRGAVLGNGQPRQIKFRRLQPCLRLRRIKGVVNVSGHLLRILTHARSHIIVRHGAGDALRQRFSGAVAMQRLVVLVLHPFAILAMALDAQLLINHGTARLRCLGGQGRCLESASTNRRSHSQSDGIDEKH